MKQTKKSSRGSQVSHSFPNLPPPTSQPPLRNFHLLGFSSQPFYGILFGSSLPGLSASTGNCEERVSVWVLHGLE
ncbi:hypothetical protein FJTKL_05782 [Diaporthe vaccinii]|uniref:Uncharacterized protein n=1 Tax=Diaporthe vaccinii TaxID=105482 RepID=A0ABR4EXY6_9PEZI